MNERHYSTIPSPHAPRSNHYFDFLGYNSLAFLTVLVPMYASLKNSIAFWISSSVVFQAAMGN